MVHPLLIGVGLVMAWAPNGAAAAPPCEARSAAQPPTVIELYTSEGCSSCPPADRWLSALPVSAAVLPLAFHVDYWDALGWRDRFASPAHTERQRQWQAVLGSRFIYTPQVLVQGRDARGLPATVTAATPPAPTHVPAVHLARSGSRVMAEVTPPAAPEAGQRYSGYWAVLEDGHQTAVGAGENQGARLRHDHVVRQYQPLPSWPAAQAQRFALDVTHQPESGDHRQRVVLVIQAERTRSPVQALPLSCPAS